MTADDPQTPPPTPRVRAHVDEAHRIVHIVLPPFDQMTDDQARAALEEAIRLRREWEAKGYTSRY